MALQDQAPSLFESRVLYSAKYKDLDFKMIDKLCKTHKGFETFIEYVEKYCNEKNIPIEKSKLYYSFLKGFFMTEGFAYRQYSDNSKCEVCGDKISHSAFLLQKEQQYFVCNSFDCTVVMNQQVTMTSDNFKAHLKFKKNNIQQRKEKEASTQKHIEEIEKNELRENENIIQLTLKKYFDIKQDDLQILAIPSGFFKLVPVPKERLKNYTEHLKTTISSAAKFENASTAEKELNTSYDGSHENLLKAEKRFEKNPVLRTISDKLCGMCKGGCCALGKDKAFLSVITIRRYMDNNPDLSEQDVLELYLSKISSETIENACINNTKTGCALPREMRSDICNGYYCDSLKSFQIEHAGKAAIGKVLAVQRSYSNWNKFDPDVSNKIVSVALVGKESFQPVELNPEIIPNQG